MKQNKWDKLQKELEDLDDALFGKAKAKLALREYLLENKEKVANDLDEMRIKSNQNKMKQTAVEWLENQIKNSKYFYKLMEDINSRSTVAQPNIFEQAKKMEKEQTFKQQEE
jgi:hypothetical protein